MPKRISRSKKHQLRGLDLMMSASTELGLYDGELEGMSLHPVPLLSKEEEAFLDVITTSGNFTVEAVSQRLAEGDKK